MNVLCLGSEVVGPSLAEELVRAFLAATFDGGERYVLRLEKVAQLERLRRIDPTRQDAAGHDPVSGTVTES